jgi:hypothetical protein
VDLRTHRSRLRLTLGARFIRLVSIGLTAFLVGGAGVACATIVLTPLGAAIGGFMRTSRSVDLRAIGSAYAPPSGAGPTP